MFGSSPRNLWLRKNPGPSIKVPKRRPSGVRSSNEISKYSHHGARRSTDQTSSSPKWKLATSINCIQIRCGFVSFYASQPLPSGQSSCIAGPSSTPGSTAPAIHNMTCVAETTKDTRLEQCSIVGYLDGACGGSPVQTQRTESGWAFEGVADVQSFKVDCSSVSNAA